MQYRNITPFRQKNINFVTNKGKKHKIDLHAGGFQTESIHGRCRNRKLHQGIQKTRRIPAGREPKYKFLGERNRGDTVPEGKRRSIIDKRRPRVQGIRIADTILVFSNFRDVRAKREAHLRQTCQNLCRFSGCRLPAPEAFVNDNRLES